MKLRVVNKQKVTDDCMVCGVKNTYGLQAVFYELENKEVVAICSARSEHQSYPGQLHGGVVAAILDETIGRAILVDAPDIMGFTVSLNLKYVKPIPMEEELRVFGRIDRNRSRMFEGSGELVLRDGTVAATATGTYIKMPIEKLEEMNPDRNPEKRGWRSYDSASDPEYIECDHRGDE